MTSFEVLTTMPPSKTTVVNGDYADLLKDLDVLIDIVKTGHTSPATSTLPSGLTLEQAKKNVWVSIRQVVYSPLNQVGLGRGPHIPERAHQPLQALCDAIRDRQLDNVDNLFKKAMFALDPARAVLEGYVDKNGNAILGNTGVVSMGNMGETLTPSKSKLVHFLTDLICN